MQFPRGGHSMDLQHCDPFKLQREDYCVSGFCQVLAGSFDVLGRDISRSFIQPPQDLQQK